MSKPHECSEPGDRVPQFDRAEFAKEAPGGPFCRECRRPIQNEYYDISGIVVCSICHANRLRFRSRLIRAFKALLLGSVAAAVGAGVYRMIMFGTGWNFSLVAILVGYMVGGAVNTGSGARGGRFYQVLAIFLTYSALVGMFLPEAWRALGSNSREHKVGNKQVAAARPKSANTDPDHNADTLPADKTAQPNTELPPDVFAHRPARDAEAKNKPTARDLKAGPENYAKSPRRASVLYLLCMLLLTFVLLIGLIYSVPVVLGIHSPISLIIFGIALWQAWRMNGASELIVTGPYRVRG
jgi:hypothetical protein